LLQIKVVIDDLQNIGMSATALALHVDFGLR
jgi:hypothetical protein